jgi:predicted transcriptional regulator
MGSNERSDAMSNLDSDDVVFDGPGAPVLTYVTTDDIVTIAPTATVRAAATAIVEQSIGMLVIGTTDDVLAVLSERDIVRAVSERRDLDTTSVADIGSRELVWIDADDNIGQAAEEMMKDYVRHALVRDVTGLVGVLSMRDVLAAYTT